MKILSSENKPSWLTNAEVTILLETLRISAAGANLRDAACNDTDAGSDDKRRRYDLMVSCGHYLDSLQTLSVNNDVAVDENSAASRIRAGQEEFLGSIENYEFGELETIALLNAMPNCAVEVVAAMRSAGTCSNHQYHSHGSSAASQVQLSTEEVCNHYCLGDDDLEYLASCCKKHLRFEQNIDIGECPRAPPDNSQVNVVLSPVMTFAKPQPGTSRKEDRQSRSRSVSQPRTPRTNSLRSPRLNVAQKSPRFIASIKSPKPSAPKSPLLTAVANLNVSKKKSASKSDTKSGGATSARSAKTTTKEPNKQSNKNQESGVEPVAEDEEEEVVTKKRGRPSKSAAAKSAGTKRKRSPTPDGASSPSLAPKSKAKWRPKGKAKGKAKAAEKKRAKKS